MVFSTKPGTDLTFGESVLNEKKRGKRADTFYSCQKSLFFFDPTTTTKKEKKERKKAILLQLGTFSKELPKSPVTGDFHMYVLPRFWTTVQ